MDLSVEDNVQDHHALLFYQVVNAVVVRQNTPDVVGNGLKARFAGFTWHGILGQAPNAGDDFILGLLGTNERGALQMADDSFYGDGRPVGDDDVSLHRRNFGSRGQMQ